MNSKVFITQYCFETIIPDNTKNIDISIEDLEKLIEYYRIKNIFNRVELELFFKVWKLLENPQLLIEHYNSQNEKDKPDIYNSFHRTKDCEELHKSFLNYVIDEEDKPLRISISKDIRSLFVYYTKLSYFIEANRTNNMELDSVKFDFEKKIISHLNFSKTELSVKIIPQSMITNWKNIREKYKINFNNRNRVPHIFEIYANSGIRLFDNASLNSIEDRIRTFLDESDNYRNMNEETKSKIKKATFCSVKKIPKLYKSKEVEKIWFDNYKKPLYDLIINYYWVKFNPDLSINKTLLEVIGLKPCKRCFKNY